MSQLLEREREKKMQEGSRLVVLNLWVVALMGVAYQIFTYDS